MWFCTNNNLNISSLLRHTKKKCCEGATLIEKGIRSRVCDDDDLVNNNNKWINNNCFYMFWLQVGLVIGYDNYSSQRGLYWIKNSKW